MRLSAQVVIAHLPVSLTAVPRGTSDERIQTVGFLVFKEHEEVIEKPPITIYLDREAGQPVRLPFHLVPKLL